MALLVQGLGNVSENILCPKTGPGEFKQMFVISKKNGVYD
jgi:hypothetical protein